jgi:hypothetical protein
MRNANTPKTTDSPYVDDERNDRILLNAADRAANRTGLAAWRTPNPAEPGTGGRVTAAWKD